MCSEILSQLREYLVAVCHGSSKVKLVLVRTLLLTVNSAFFIQKQCHLNKK